MVEDWEDCEKFQSHVLTLHHHYCSLGRVLGIQMRPSFEFIELIYSCAWYMCERGRFDVCKDLIATCQAGYDEIVRLEDPQSWSPGIIPSDFLSDIYTVQLFYHTEVTSDFSMVELARKALNIREDAVRRGLLDPYHPNLANGFMNVGVAMTWKNPRGAIEMHTRALHIWLGSEKYRDSQVHGLALNYLNVGCWLLVGDLVTAASCFERSLEIIRARERKVGKRFTLTAWAMSALGTVRGYQGDFATAATLISESLNMHLDTMGDKHMKTLSCYYRLAWVYHRVGEFERAQQILDAIPKAYCGFIPAPKPEITRTKFKLSQVLHDQGFPPSQWEVMQKEARLLLSEIVGENDGVVKADDEDAYDRCIAYFLR